MFDARKRPAVLGTKLCVTSHAEFALSTGNHMVERHTISNLNLGNARANGGYDAGALMSHNQVVV